jgi:hypothetical protein
VIQADPPKARKPRKPRVKKPRPEDQQQAA